VIATFAFHPQSFKENVNKVRVHSSSLCSHDFDVTWFVRFGCHR